MTRYTGANCVVQWLPSAGGTINLATDFTQVSITPTGSLVKVTAGDETFESYLATNQDTKVDLQAYGAVGGTATEDALLPNVFGTLIVGPEGTASGKRRYTIPAFSMGAAMTYPFNGATALAVSFQGSGTPTFDTY